MSRLIAVLVCLGCGSSTSSSTTTTPVDEAVESTEASPPRESGVRSLVAHEVEACVVDADDRPVCWTKRGVRRLEGRAEWLAMAGHRVSELCIVDTNETRCRMGIMDQERFLSFAIANVRSVHFREGRRCFAAEERVACTNADGVLVDLERRNDEWHGEDVFCRGTAERFRCFVPTEIGDPDAWAGCERGATTTCWPFGSAFDEVEFPDDVDDAGLATHACYLRGGTVTCGGSGAHGELGNGAIGEHEEVEASELAGAREIAVAERTTCAIVGDVVRCVGAPLFWTNGDPSFVELAHRGVVHQLDGRTCVRNDEGTQCTQTNTREAPFAQLGWEAVDLPIVDVDYSARGLDEGVTECVLSDRNRLKCELRFGSLEPEARVERQNVVEVDVSDVSTCARLRNGRVECWRNLVAIGGDDPLTRHVEPTRIRGVSGAVSLAISGRLACAALRSGKVQCWGARQNGTEWSDHPLAEVEGLEGAVEVELLWGPSSRHVCARNSEGTVTCTDFSCAPFVLRTDVAAMEGCFRTNEGGMVCPTSASEPATECGPGRIPLVEVELPAAARRLSSGAVLCAELQDGRVVCGPGAARWGWASRGELGELPSWVALEAFTLPWP